jgi:hypothetical protein
MPGLRAAESALRQGLDPLDDPGRFWADRENYATRSTIDDPAILGRVSRRRASRARLRPFSGSVNRTCVNRLFVEEERVELSM